MAVSTIIQAGGGSFTTIQAFFDWVFATYGTATFPEEIIGEIQDSATYNETAVANVGLVPTLVFPLILRSNADDPANFPTIAGGAGTGLTIDLGNYIGKLVKVEGIKFTGAGNGIYTGSYNGGTSQRVKRCIFDGLNYGINKPVINMRIDVCLFKECNYGTYNAYSGTKHYTHHITNSTFYKCGHGIQRYTSTGYGFIYSYNNVFYIGNGQYAYSVYYTATKCLGGHENNCYYREAGGAIMDMVDAGDIVSLADWQTACPASDVLSIEQDPLFVNAGGGDFRLQDTSPAKNLGDPWRLPLDVNDIYDANFDEVTPSAGAYQNLSALTPAMSALVGPLGVTYDTTPTEVWLVGTRDTGGYGANSGTAQYTIVLWNRGIYGLLNGALTAAATTINYDGEIGTIPASGTIKLEDELIDYTGKAGGQLTGCTRGAHGTVARAHTDNNRFYSVEQIKDSWVAGANYDADLSWFYSSDFIQGENPESYGTWNAMGTLAASPIGVEGVNGVSVNPSVTRYCKVQLTGIVAGRNYSAGLVANNGVVV